MEKRLEYLALQEVRRRVYPLGKKVGYKPVFECVLTIKGAEALMVYTIKGNKRSSIERWIKAKRTPRSVQELLEFRSICFRRAKELLEKYEGEVLRIKKEAQAARREFKKTKSRESLKRFQSLAQEYWCYTGNRLRIKVPRKDKLPQDLSDELS